MSYYSIQEKEKWLPYIEKRLVKTTYSEHVVNFLKNLEVTYLDYGEFERSEVEGGEIITWYMDFTYNGKKYEYRRSEVLETGKHLCYGYYLEHEKEEDFFENILLHKIKINENELYDVLEIFDGFFLELK